jgi:hypothetical protein
VPVRLHETQPPELTVPKGDHVQPILSGLSVKISRAWVHRVRESWRRLSGRAVPDAEFEPRIVPEQSDRMLTATLPEIPLESVTPVQRAYWSFRRELRNDVKDIADFVLAWDAQVNTQKARTEALVAAKDALAAKVAALPRTDQIAGQVKKVQERMAKAKAETEKMGEEVRQLLQGLETVKKAAKLLRRELFQ